MRRALLLAVALLAGCGRTITEPAACVVARTDTVPNVADSTRALAVVRWCQ